MYSVNAACNTHIVVDPAMSCHVRCIVNLNTYCSVIEAVKQVYFYKLYTRRESV